MPIPGQDAEVVRSFSETLPPADRTNWTGPADQAPPTAQVLAEYHNQLVTALAEVRTVLATLGAVPAGGRTGQALVKLSDASQSVGWADAVGGGTDSLAERVTAIEALIFGANTNQITDVFTDEF